jgi:hypothetical protein
MTRIIVDPHADQPKLLNSRWRRRKPQGDPYDTVIIRGVYEMGELGFELVISGVEFSPAVTIDADAFAAEWTRADDNPTAESVERVAQRLEEIAARGGVE